MDIRFQAGGPALWKAPVLIVLACKGQDPALSCPEVAEVAPWFAIAPGRRDFSGHKLEQALFHGHPDLAIPRVLVVGLGERDSLTLDTLRKAAATALARCRELGLTGVLVPATQFDALPGGPLRLIEEFVCGARLGLYRYTALRSPKPDDPDNPLNKADPEWLALAFADAHVPDAPHAAARRGEHAADAVALARDLANAPANIMTPTALGEAAQDVAKKHGMACTILDEAALTDLGCHCLLAVGQGSAEESRLIIMEHVPKGRENEKPVIFVGKGLTFDSGGISIKPGQNMHIMKSDMAGAAAIVGAMDAIGQENIPRRTIAVLACAENMPGGKAMRPGDVVKSLAGKTVEILNTDAEGRLVLCDALTYAQERWEPALLLDVATLTGACAIALGHEVAGLFTDDDALAAEVQSIGAVVGDPFWRLPLWQPYQELLKSDVADLSHLGPREGGSINAALFLKNFIKDGVRWAHCDIAGTDWAFKKTPLTPVGAVGFSVRMLVDLVRGGMV